VRSAESFALALKLVSGQSNAEDSADAKLYRAASAVFRLRDDLALQTAVGSDRAAASSPTLCRFENRADRQTAVVIQQ
jgi:hypothetical protein